MNNRHSAKAFTIIEVVIVIGIIGVLISILLPVGNKLRRQAKVTTTTQLIAAIEGAVNQYQSEQREWPGPLDHDADRSTGGPWNQIIYPPPATPQTFPVLPTRSEELLLCLTGGMNISWSPNPPFIPAAFTYNANDHLRGHMKLGPKVRGRMPAYIDNRAAFSTKNYLADTGIPEFVDNFEQPILYVRAKKGVVGVDAYTTNLENEVDRYQDPVDKVTLLGTYLTSETLPGQTRKRDGFILISAGPDQKFGTADDIGNFGAPTMP